MEPALLLGLAAWITTRLGRREERLARHRRPLRLRAFAARLRHVARALWLPLLHRPLHHRPVTQNAFAEIGWPILGDPRWTLVGLPQTVVEPIEFGFLLLGLAGSLLVAWRLAEDDSEKHPVRAFAPWGVLCMILFFCCVWLMTQPMDMRATMMAG